MEFACTAGGIAGVYLRRSSALISRAISLGDIARTAGEHQGRGFAGFSRRFFFNSPIASESES